jgi:hypothetical protein
MIDYLKMFEVRKKHRSLMTVSGGAWWRLSVGWQRWNCCEKREPPAAALPPGSWNGEMARSKWNPKGPPWVCTPSSKWWCKFTDSKGTIFGDLTKTNWWTCSANGLHSWWENKHVGLPLETHRHPNFLKAPNGTSWEIHYGDMLYSFGGFLKPLGGDLTNQVSPCG